MVVFFFLADLILGGGGGRLFCVCQGVGEDNGLLRISRIFQQPGLPTYYFIIKIKYEWSLVGLCFSLGYSSAPPEWLEPVLWPRTWLCELMWEKLQQQHHECIQDSNLARSCRTTGGLAGQTSDNVVSESSLPPPLLRIRTWKSLPLTPHCACKQKSILKKSRLCFFPIRSRRDIRENSKSPTFPT